MIKNRRAFLTTGAGALAGLAFRGAWVGASTGRDETTTKDVLRSLGDYPLANAVTRFRADQPRAIRSFQETGLSRKEYLRLAQGIVRFFAAHQDARGAIIDPYTQKERQYSTPAFACAAAILHASGHDRHLLPACMKAMDAATADLAEGNAADRHSDFYTILLMHAYDALRRHAPARRRAVWQAALRRVDPRRIYRLQPNSPSINNWNLVAASGEWLRYQAGMSADTGWIEASLDRHMAEFTPYGMYRDPDDPLAYDHFARYHIVQMLEHGYAGRHAAALQALMERGVWTSLFMQSPHGEWPCGGRSAHHQWNEAEQAMTYEVYAHRFARRGDTVGAGACRRAARLALRSVSRWVRPSGELWIVKNHFDPALRHGYESYSFHSQYNLLAAAMLTVAYRHAQDRIQELPCPADIGGFVVSLQPAFHKVFANAGGMYVEIDTRADARYNPTGLLRVHRAGVDPQLSISDGVTKKCGYQLPRPPERSLAIGPAWRDRENTWHALAEHESGDLREAEVKIARVAPDLVEFDVAYSGALRGGATSVRQKYTLTPACLMVTDTVTGEITGLRQYFPLLVSDGRRTPRIEVTGRSARAMLDGDGTHTYTAQGEGEPLGRLGVSEPSRNGLLDAAFAEGPGHSMQCVIEPKGSEEGGVRRFR